ncbi:SARP family transcriptional regulator, partial [Saccharothrix sp. MB29]|nr:SARP family transcriptional regulator [Saccharothrix sp. MB29]
DQVRDLLPGGSGCAAIVTSRTELTGLVVREGVRRLGLGLLAEADARRLLGSRLEGVPADDDALATLAAQCAGLPLALAIAAGRAARHRGFPLDVLVDELRTQSRRLDALDTGDPYTTVRAVFSWSYRALSVSARRLFRLLVLPTGADLALPAAASLAGLPVGPTRALLGELTGANLLEEHLPGRFRCHDLLREYAAERLLEEEPVESRDAAARRLFDSYLRTAAAIDAILNPHRLRVALPPPEPGVTAAEPADYRQALAWCAAEHHT